MTKLIDTKMLRYAENQDVGIMKIDDEHIYPTNNYYETLDDSEILGMKPVGRIYFNWSDILEYWDGSPTEWPIISGGESGIADKYLKAGEAVYTEEMVLNIIRSKVYENNINLISKLPTEIYYFLEDVADGKLEGISKDAKKLLEKFDVIEMKKEDK